MDTLKVKRSILVKPGMCRVMRAGQFFCAGSLAVGLDAIQPGDVLVLSKRDYPRFKAGMANSGTKH